MWLELWDVRRLELSIKQCSPFQVHQHNEDSKLRSFLSGKSFPKSAYMPPHAYATPAPISQTLEHAGPPLPLWQWEPTAVCMCQLCSLDVCLSLHFEFLWIFPSLPLMPFSHQVGISARSMVRRVEASQLCRGCCTTNAVTGKHLEVAAAE